MPIQNQEQETELNNMEFNGAARPSVKNLLPKERILRILGLTPSISRIDTNKTSLRNVS